MATPSEPAPTAPLPSRATGPTPTDLERVAAAIPSRGGDAVLVGIDGVDGSGKTTFADALAPVVARRRPVVRVSVDDFHHPRAVRYRRGRHSPVGYWEDAFDYARLREFVLDPLGPRGTRRYRSRAHCLATDEPLDEPWRLAAPGTVVIVDGVFLHRDELREHWQLSVFLDVPFAETWRRMAQRDGCDPDPEHPSNARYLLAQRRYVRSCRPDQRADLVLRWREPAH